MQPSQETAAPGAWHSRPSASRAPVFAAWLLGIAALAIDFAMQPAVAQSTAPRPLQAAPAQDEARLRALEDAIGTEQRRLGDARRSREQLEDELARSERDAAVVVRRLRQIEVAQARKSEELAELDAARSDRDRRLARLRGELARQVRASFAIGRHDTLKLVLGQNDLARLGRVVAYHRYVSVARAGRVSALRAEIARLDDLEQGIREEQAALAALGERARAARDELDLQRATRQRLLADLNGQIKGTSGRLAVLQRDAEALATLLARLAETPAVAAAASRPAASAGRSRSTTGTRDGATDVPEAPGMSFAALRGGLGWPTTGRMRHGFGAPRHAATVTAADAPTPRWQGVRLDAPAGQPIRAVADGQVAYADWLRGFGLLVILDHGDGFMSLYGHARELLAEPGDWMQGGEVLGTVGDSGGQSQPGLYFEIRRNGRPLNPAEWCTGPPHLAQATARRAGG